MALEVTNLERVFTMKKNGKTIPLSDPDPSMPADKVMNFYASRYPELTNSNLEGPKYDKKKKVATYSFITHTGTKG